MSKEQSVGSQLKPGMGSGGRVYEGRGKVWCGTHNRYELKEAYDGVRAGEVRAELHREGEAKDQLGHGSDKSTAHKGYYIKHNQMRDEFYIQKDGQHISTHKSVDDAKRTIDRDLTSEAEVKDARGHGSEKRVSAGHDIPREHRDAFNAGAQYVRDNWGDNVNEHSDLQSQAQDLAQGAGHDPDYTHEGMVRQQDKLSGKKEAGAGTAAAPLLRAEVETQSGGKGQIPRGVLVLGNQPQPVRQFAQLERPKKMGFAREQAGIPAGRDAAPGASKNVAPVLGGLSIEAKNKLQALRATLVAKEPDAHPHDEDVPIKSFVDDLRHKIGKRRVMPGGDLDQDANPKPAEGENTQKSPDGPVDQKGVPLPGQPIYSKEEVNYRYAPDPKRSCGECRFYLEPGSCRLVMGLILKTDVCDKFEEDDEVKRTEDEMRPTDGMQGPKVVRGHLVTESLREVGWTDEARAAAAIARQHGYKDAGKTGSGSSKHVRAGHVPGAGKVSDAHEIMIHSDGTWKRWGPGGTGGSGRTPGSLSQHLTDVHGEPKSGYQGNPAAHGAAAAGGGTPADQGAAAARRYGKESEMRLQRGTLIESKKLTEARGIPYFARHKNGEMIGLEGALSLARRMEALGYESPLGEVTPPGWEGSVKAMKKHGDITNPWALAWYMKGKGYTPHKEQLRKLIQGEEQGAPAPMGGEEGEMGFFRPGDRGWKPQGGQAEPDKGVGFRASEDEAKDARGHGSEKRGSGAQTVKDVKNYIAGRPSPYTGSPSPARPAGQALMPGQRGWKPPKGAPEGRPDYKGEKMVKGLPTKEGSPDTSYFGSVPKFEGDKVAFPGKSVHFEPHKPHAGELDHPLHQAKKGVAEALRRRIERQLEKQALREIREARSK